MRDIISINFFSQRNKYPKLGLLERENISISQNFIACFFCNLHFLAQNMYQKIYKTWKIQEVFGQTKKSDTLNVLKRLCMM